MHSDEEDYMSDKFLGASEQNDVRPGLLFNTKQKRTHELYKKQQELKAKKPKTYHEQEQETREKGLSTAISSDNKGFQLLAKMGFRPGASLGKSQDGLKEPINITVKPDTSGVGRDRHVKEVIKQKIDVKEKFLERQANTFRASRAEKNLQIMMRKDLYKAQQVCEELDTRNDVSVPKNEFFWTRQTVAKLKKCEDSDEEESDDDEYEKFMTEENLFKIIDYLRENYFYCLYCGFRATDNDDLNQNCPGPYRTDHDSQDL